jgi:lipopolysaccharide/colanic/teichoic acid biosynthesis glycosyltransferase
VRWFEGPDGRPLHKVRSDPRVTRAGHWLRRFSIDELPQLFNVLRGEMSLIGPRPELPEFVAAYRPWQHRRHLVRPGLTGWAQVKYEYGATDSDALEKLQYDFFYLQNQSVTLDLLVIRRTIRHVFGMGGR